MALAIDPQDLEQEAALFLLEKGKRPSKSWILRRLISAEEEQGICFSDCSSAQDMHESCDDRANCADSFAPASSYEAVGNAIDGLVDFALKQGPEVQERIWAFLDDADAEFERTLRYLIDVGLIPEEPPKSSDRPAATAAGLLTRHLQMFPDASFEDLVKLVQREHPTRRPAALVRQFLRRNPSLARNVRKEDA